jgi:hypothetical protein
MYYKQVNLLENICSTKGKVADFGILKRKMTLPPLYKHIVTKSKAIRL